MQATIDFNKLSNVAEIGVKYSHHVKLSERPKVTSSQDAYDIFYAVWNKDDIQFRESFMILLLNRTNVVMGVSLISTGAIAGTTADPKIIFALALKAAASSIILAHNHPSGNTHPSQADLTLTKKLKEAGQFLELPVLDHLILGERDGYSPFFSLADNGLL